MRHVSDPALHRQTSTCIDKARTPGRTPGGQNGGRARVAAHACEGHRPLIQNPTASGCRHVTIDASKESPCIRYQKCAHKQMSAALPVLQDHQQRAQPTPEELSTPNEAHTGSLSAPKHVAMNHAHLRTWRTVQVGADARVHWARECVTLIADERLQVCVVCSCARNESWQLAASARGTKTAIATHPSPFSPAWQSGRARLLHDTASHSSTASAASRSRWISRTSSCPGPAVLLAATAATDGEADTDHVRQRASEVGPVSSGLMNRRSLRPRT